MNSCGRANEQTNGQTDRQTNRRTGGKTDKDTDAQTVINIDMQTDKAHSLILSISEFSMLPPSDKYVGGIALSIFAVLGRVQFLAVQCSVLL